MWKLVGALATFTEGGMPPCAAFYMASCIDALLLYWRGRVCVFHRGTSLVCAGSSSTTSSLQRACQVTAPPAVLCVVLIKPGHMHR